jgi:ribosome-associated heat shock protein Hsp15
LDRQRIDKWLWHARMLRTRSAATALVEAGHVRLNGRRVTAASQLVRAGDVITLALDRSVRLIEVAGFCERRGGAGAARALYRDMTRGSGREASAAGETSPMLAPPGGKGNRTASL